MKKLLGIVLSAAMLLSMAACGSTAASSAASSAAADSTADAATATDAAASDLKVGVITIGDEKATLLRISTASRLLHRSLA